MCELGSLVHSYPVEHGVPDQDASFRANRLGVAGPIFGDGDEPRRAPVTRHPRLPDAPEIDVPDEPGLLDCLQARPLGHQPSPDVSPQSNQQLPGECDRRNLAHAPAHGPDPLGEPPREGAVWLVA